MDSPPAPPRPRPVDGRERSRNLEIIEAAFQVSMDEGFEAGLEALLDVAHADCEFRPYVADRVLRGHDEIRSFYRGLAEAGTEMRLRPTSFRETGDRVVVDGTVRVLRAAGGFSESQISWTYRFRDGLLAEAGWSPRRGS
jgi:ketosteroid isomerase-like protein